VRIGRSNRPLVTAAGRDGFTRTAEFVRASNRTDSVVIIRSRFQTAFGVSFDAVENDWLLLLRTLTNP
jgi:hypothetical protein